MERQRRTVNRKIKLLNARDFKRQRGECKTAFPSLVMGGARLELASLSAPHFECGASTNSAIRPCWWLYHYTQLGDF
jgi:hypothetical protein